MLNPTWTFAELRNALRLRTHNPLEAGYRVEKDKIVFYGAGWAIELNEYGYEAGPDGEG